MIKFLLIFILFILLSSSFMYNITKKLLKKIIHHNLSFYITIFHSILFLFIIRLILEINILKEAIDISETKTFNEADNVDIHDHDHSFNSTNYDELYQGISGDIIYNDNLDQDLLIGNELINIVNEPKKKDNLLHYAQLYEGGEENTIRNLSDYWHDINDISWNNVIKNYNDIKEIVDKNKQINTDINDLDNKIARLKKKKNKKLSIKQKKQTKLAQQGSAVSPAADDADADDAENKPNKIANALKNIDIRKMFKRRRRRRRR